jgi:hypothetical protein
MSMRQGSSELARPHFDIAGTLTAGNTALLNKQSHLQLHGSHFTIQNTFFTILPPLLQLWTRDPAPDDTPTFTTSTSTSTRATPCLTTMTSCKILGRRSALPAVCIGGSELTDV